MTHTPIDNKVGLNKNPQQKPVSTDIVHENTKPAKRKRLLRQLGGTSFSNSGLTTNADSANEPSNNANEVRLDTTPTPQEHEIVYYDTRSGEYIYGIRQSLLPKDPKQKRYFDNDVSAVLEILNEENGLHMLRNMCSRDSRTVFSQLSIHDPFVRQEAQKELFDSTPQSFRKRGKPHGWRLVFSVTSLKSNQKPVVILHFYGSHKDYDRWRREHFKKSPAKS